MMRDQIEVVVMLLAILLLLAVLMLFSAVNTASSCLGRESAYKHIGVIKPYKSEKIGGENSLH